MRVFRRRYLTASGRQGRAQQTLLQGRSEARKILLEFVNQGEVAELRVTSGGAILAMNDGRRYWWDPDDHVLRMFTVSLRGDFEAKETQFLRSVLRPGDVALDIGASFGWYTMIFSRSVGPEGRVYAFEPLPWSFDVLRKNCELNQADNVVVSNVAVGASTGERELYLPDIGSSGAFHVHEYHKEYETFCCRVQPLDDYVAEFDIRRVDLVKADIEGAELEMLQGATGLLQMMPQPMWMIEIQAKSCMLYGHRPQAVFDLMHRFGYSPYYVSKAGALQPLLDIQTPLPDYNFVFLGSADRIRLEE